MKYNPNEIEAKWQKYWLENQTFKAENNSEKPKYYVLDMFPYPSGAGLHVGHPLGYIASDVYSRYKRHQGFNVLHPMGYDSFGLPAEQYAIQTGQRPEDTTSVNIDGGTDKEGNKIAGYRKQLDKIGFSFDWSREVRTSNPDYYKHTQWIFIQLFNSWYNKNSDKAEDISTLVSIFVIEGNANVNAVCDENIEAFSANEWNAFAKEQQEKILLQYRLTYLAETEVNWCPGLGTVLANDEIVNGVSERGGFTVVRKKMTQWSMRISAYAERLLQGLNDIDWSESIKESQRNWIGKSVGATVEFNVQNSEAKIAVFTTRPDTIFGVTFMTLAPEHELVSQITTAEQIAEVDAYIEKTSKRSERERMADVKTISGVFTGAYAEHPFTKEPIPVWIGDYVLAGYGTGAVMAVPCGDERDYAFANFFKGQNGMQEIKNIFDKDISEAAFGAKEGFQLVDSDFLNGLDYKKGTQKVIAELEKLNQGKGKTNYRLRDAVFSRQRYWGEPFPVYYVNGLPQMIDAQYLPIILPEVEKYLPTEDGLPPLGNATVWAWNTETNEVVNTDLVDNKTIFPLELNTMPGWAGSSWYWMRYMDAHNENEFASKDALAYWESVDLYIGGSEHATGHLLYSRFWNKFLKDKGFAPTEEPFKKLINQGMILGMSAFVSKIGFKIIAFKKPQELQEGEKRTLAHQINTQLAAGDEDFEKFNQIVEKVEVINDTYLSTDVIEYFNLTSENEKDKDFMEMHHKLLHHFLDSVYKELNENGFDKKYEIKLSPLNGVKFYRLHVPVSFVSGNDELDFENLKKSDFQYKEAKFLMKNDKFFVSREIEKMSKSKYNVVTPDDICNEYGADTLRLYEMFLGPLEQAKPWNTAGISGVFGFLKKLCRLYFDENGLIVTNDAPTKDNLKSLHKTIKKVAEDIEGFSFNTSVSQFMICVNELSTQNCHSRAILEPLAIVISPYAPHIAEELWSLLGNAGSIATVDFPIFDAQHLVESSKEYPVSFNGKMRFTMVLPLDLTKEQIEEIVMKDERTIKQLEGRTPNKVIIVPGKIINLVG
ncbi:leucine--tRNA ligase [Flavobacterium psychrolimnae]|uniref:Leucine--tRNA ligase n=1 Tax=Flavobacterium psychrolimnae TaxID=249351 RepID=A0A366B4Y6_9FLAO|nr:class I tRNA ligase family protein [Flavobacterium psychrolimnae]RBN51258.1 leucine--tRNA ligase [Flavobacterium psychrolimnae]